MTGPAIRIPVGVRLLHDQAARNSHDQAGSQRYL